MRYSYALFVSCLVAGTTYATATHPADGHKHPASKPDGSLLAQEVTVAPFRMPRSNELGVAHSAKHAIALPRDLDELDNALEARHKGKKGKHHRKHKHHKKHGKHKKKGKGRKGKKRGRKGRKGRKGGKGRKGRGRHHKRDLVADGPEEVIERELGDDVLLFLRHYVADYRPSLMHHRRARERREIAENLNDLD